MPATLAPMHADLADAAFNHPDWMWEPKLDGYRVLALIENEKVRLRTRRGLDLAADFPKLCAELGKQAVNSMILDGEIVAFDAEGKPSFNAMQNRARAGACGVLRVRHAALCRAQSAQGAVFRSAPVSGAVLVAIAAGAAGARR